MGQDRQWSTELLMYLVSLNDKDATWQGLVTCPKPALIWVSVLLTSLIVDVHGFSVALYHYWKHGKLAIHMVEFWQNVHGIPMIFCITALQIGETSVTALFTILYIVFVSAFCRSVSEKTFLEDASPENTIISHKFANHLRHASSALIWTAFALIILQYATSVFYGLIELNLNFKFVIMVVLLILCNALAFIDFFKYYVEIVVLATARFSEIAGNLVCRDVDTAVIDDNSSKILKPCVGIQDDPENAIPCGPNKHDHDQNYAVTAVGEREIRVPCLLSQAVLAQYFRYMFIHVCEILLMMFILFDILAETRIHSQDTWNNS